MESKKASYDVCRHHHERYDGKGYPDGLAGEDIPLSAQLVSVADVYDALVNERCYKDAYSPQDAETAFRAAHTLKGLCMNLGFDSLYEVSSALTENLRGRQLNGWESLFEKVEQRYLIVRETLEEFQTSE